MELTIDFETRDDHIKTLGAGWACSSDFKVVGCSVSVDGAPAYWTTKPQEIKDLVNRADVLIGHNAQYDFGILLAMGLDISKKTLVDTIIMCKLDYNQHQSYSLDAMAKVHLGADESKQTDELAAVIDKHKLYKEKGKSKKCTDIKKLKSYARGHIWEIYLYEPEIVEMYCNQDVNLTQRLYRQLKSKMDPQWMYRASCVLQQCLHGRKAGVPVDIEQLKKTREAIALKELSCKMQLAQQLDMLVEDLQLSATKILPTYLDKLGIKYPRTEKGAPSVKAKWLEDHKHPFCQILHKYRKYQKIRRDFCDKLLECQLLMRPDKRGFVYPEFTMFGANRTGRFSCRNPNCFSADTEVLTQTRGWCQISDLQQSDQIAQYTESDNSISFTAFTNYFSQEVDNIYNITTAEKNIDLAVTADHRLLLFTRQGKAVITDANNYFSDHKQLHAGLYNNTLELDDKLLHLIFMIQADGYFGKQGVDFSFMKKRKIDNIILYYGDIGKYDTRRRYRFTLKYSDVPAIVWQYINRQTKTFTSELYKLARPNILDYFMFWDGDWIRKSEWKTAKLENIAPVQAMLSLSNLRAISVVRPVKGKDYYGVRVKQSNYSWTTNAIVARSDVKQRVYCLSVPSSYVLVRRNGITHITGQCQQIPARDKELGPLIRACYVARPGETWYSLDISQQEFRVFAHYAHVLKWDSLLYLEYKANPTKDFHSIVAEACQISRDDAKPINLGSLYGMGKKKMALQLHKDEDETEDLLEQYHERLPAVKLGLRACAKVLKERGFIKTLGGRLSYIDPPMFKDGEKITFEYKGLNKAIQGSSGDQIYEALTLLWERGIVVLFSVHDELCLSTANPKDAEIAADVLSTCMIKMCNFTVPMIIDIGGGKNWAEAKGK